MYFLKGTASLRDIFFLPRDASVEFHREAIVRIQLSVSLAMY